VKLPCVSSAELPVGTVTFLFTDRSLASCPRVLR
jgi:hypothetical protein